MRSLTQLGLLSILFCASSCSIDHAPSIDASPPGGDGGNGWGDAGTCAAPTTVTYSTDPLPAGSAGCIGNPPTYPSPAVPDPMAVYPVGTLVTMPFCHQYYPGFAASCTCFAGGGAPQWSCGL